MVPPPYEKIVDDFFVWFWIRISYTNSGFRIRNPQFVYEFLTFVYEIRIRNDVFVYEIRIRNDFAKFVYGISVPRAIRPPEISFVYEIEIRIRIRIRNGFWGTKFRPKSITPIDENSVP